MEIKEAKKKIWVNYKCRCRGCMARKTLKKKPDDYKIQPKCNCGIRSWFIDWNRQIKGNYLETCKMDCMAAIYGYHFPHKTNTVGCRCNDKSLINMGGYCYDN